ncbi:MULTISPECIES: TetR/AcrR family transcriptional regulator [Amycolatopsis]|uniref:TetR/AcrR family transcriptional regulator n=1 Tax=Amycolatopsis tucumanensis TaxID=401106 RepID=A0ABP7J3E8_9PSEU|nr:MULTISPECIES: TetR/AcrR family transcriptional regulator [Amycolatopsis]MCF6425262.1 TetR/AcrR family transcriptional regulator [Amycolatopsis tucumanensis]
MTDVDVAGTGFRDRLLQGMAAALRERDYHDVTIADVVNHARTSKRTFYEQFASKQECFVELLRQTNARMIRDIAAAVERDAPWQAQARQAVEALIASMESDPALCLSWMRAAPSLGEAGRALSRETMDSFVALMRTLADTPELRAAGVVPPSRELAITLFGGLRELIAITLEEGGNLAGTVDVATEVVMLIMGPRAR